MLFQPRNIVLFRRIDQAVTELVAPLIAGILAEGRSEGSFDVPDPKAFAEMLLQLRLSIRSSMQQALRDADAGRLDEVASEFDERLRLYGVAVDRLLKLPDGTFQVAEPGFAKAFLA